MITIDERSDTAGLDSIDSEAIAHTPAEDDARELESMRLWIRKAASVCEQAAKGNLEARLLDVDVDGDLARMIHGINALLDNTDAFVREAKASLDYAAKGKFFRRVVLTGMLGTFRHAAQLINVASEEMEQQSREIADAVTQREKMADEFEASVQSVATIVASAATQMQATAETLSESTQQTAEESDSALETSRQTAENVRKTAESISQLATSVSSIEAKVVESAGIVRRAVSEADQAGAVVTELNQSSANIDTVVRAISHIAKQTNILALNASIEAARAGESGRAFAIVASEVKSLAQETHEATQKVGGEIKNIQEGVLDAVEAIVTFSTTIKQLDTISDSISRSVSEQSAATADMNRNVEEGAQRTNEVTESIDRVSAIAKQTSLSTKDVLEAAHELSRQSVTLDNCVRGFLDTVRGTNR